MVGQAFTTDVEEVDTYIISFTSDNTVIEVKMVAHAAENYGRLDFMVLQDYYKGVGVHAVSAVQADKLLNDFFG